MTMSLYDLVMRNQAPAGSMDRITKQGFGRIMHDPEATDEQIEQALQMLQTAGGYENLED